MSVLPSPLLCVICPELFARIASASPRIQDSANFFEPIVTAPRGPAARARTGTRERSTDARIGGPPHGEASSRARGRCAAMNSAT